MIFIDSEVATDGGTGALVSELFIGMVEEGYVVSSVTAGAAVKGGRTKSDGGRVTPGRLRGGRPVEHNTNTNCQLLLQRYL